MEPISIPLSPQWCVTSPCVSTPDDGFIYVGWETVNYVSKIEPNKSPIMKVFHIRQKIKCLDCDPEWTEHKQFAISAADNSVQIWDLNEDKAIKGHNAHIKVHGDGELKNLESVKLCYLKNRKIFSIDLSSSVIYCSTFNTYTKNKRIIPLKYEISIVKGAPYDENIIACGTNRGLVLIVNIANKQILFTLRGHDTEITSLCWNTWNSKIINRKNHENNDNFNTQQEHNQQQQQQHPKRRPLKRSDPETISNDIIADVDAIGGVIGSNVAAISNPIDDNSDIFDIFNYAYLENDTFGVPKTVSNNTENQKQQYESDDENNIEIEDTDYEKPKDLIHNENFNYVEACQNLKDDILSSRNNYNDNYVNDKSSLTKKNYEQEQVTLLDCQQSLGANKLNSTYNSSIASQSGSLTSHNSTDIIEGQSTPDDITQKYDFYEENYQDKYKRNMNNNNSNKNCANENNNELKIYLASAANEPTIWIWNIRTGAAVQSLDVKSSSSSSNLAIYLCWMNESTIISNTRSGEIALWKCQQENVKGNTMNFIRENRTFNHRNITGLCKLRNSNIIWMLSHARKIICFDIDNNKILANYSCASTVISTIRECPENLNKLAFATGDRRICIIDVSNITPTNVSMENFVNKINSTVLSLSWSPNGKYIVFGTAEGRIAVIDASKPSVPPVIMKPFSGKPIYSLEWCNDQIFACSNERVAIYNWIGKSQEPIILENVTDASAIYVKSHYLLVGTQSGFLNILKRDDENSCNFEKITSTYVAPKYISEISFNLINPNKFAISSLANKIVVFSISYETDVLTSERVLMMNDYSSGNAWVKWSNNNENLLLSCGFDGAVRIWDLSLLDNELILLKQYHSPMYCGIFSPINENVIICAGKATSLEMFDINNEKSNNQLKLSSGGVCHKKPSWRKNKFKPIGIQWATRIYVDQEKLKSKERRRKRRHKNIDSSSINDNFLIGGNNYTNTTKDIAEGINKLAINDENEHSTVLHVTHDEINKNSLCSLLKILQNDDDDDDDDNNDTTANVKSNNIISLKMFGDKKDAQELLNEELRNHQTSNFKTISQIIIPQLGNTLKDEILNSIQMKNLTVQHVALAPAISYTFWSSCCMAYADQLIETGYVLQAISYYLACHKIKECIQVLIKNHYFHEAWILAKIHREKEDPILNEILEKWIDYFQMNGNFESAAFICALSKRYKQCRSILLRRRQFTEEHKTILDILNRRLEN